jgi:hypothetical protein
MNSEDYFLELKTKSEYISKLNFDNVAWVEHFGFLVYQLSNDLVQQELTLQKINERFEIESLGILKMNPNTVYNWHMDEQRGLSINMLLTTDHISHCIFTEKRKEKEDISKILELDYVKDTFYVFNTQELHTVINLQKPRYLFSLEFKDKKHKLLYNEVKQYCIDNNV